MITTSSVDFSIARPGAAVSVRLVFTVWMVSLSLRAQQVAAPTAAAAAASGTVVMSPFILSEDKDVGYRSTNRVLGLVAPVFIPILQDERICPFKKYGLFGASRPSVFRGDSVTVIGNLKLAWNLFLELAGMNNELFMQKGALIYAPGLATQKISTKEYAGGAFANYSLKLAAPADRERFLGYRMPAGTDLPHRQRPGDYVYRAGRANDPRLPFDNPPGVIEGTFVYQRQTVRAELLPIGSLLLRKVLFEQDK